MKDEQHQEVELLDVDGAIDLVTEHINEVLVDAARVRKISDQADFEAAGAFLTETLKPALAELDDTFGPIKRKARAAWQEVVDQEKRHRQPLEEAERIVKAAMGAYITEQRRIAAAAEATRMAEARKAAEDDAVAEAARLEDAGHADAAEERISRPSVPVVSAPAPAPPKAAGVSARSAFKYRIVDESKIGRKYLQPDASKIGKVVRAMGADAAELVGGIEVYEEAQVAARASR